MSKQKILIVISALALVAVVVFVLRAPPDANVGSEAGLEAGADGAARGADAQAAASADAAPTGLSKDVDTFNGQSLYKTFREDLPSAGGAWTCASGAELKALAEHVQNAEVGSKVGEYWESESAPKKFLFYENASRTLVACDGKQIASIKFDSNQGLSPEEELVTVADPAFGDWDGDGAMEFKIFRGQCVEGPCLGGAIVFRQTARGLTKLAELSGAQTKVTLSPGKPTTVLVQSPCYDYEFGSAFDSYYGVEFVGGKELLKLIPFQSIRTRFPQVIDDLRKQAQTTYPEEAPIQAAFRKLQDLVVRAYEGQSYETLMTEYRATLKAFPADVDENGKPVSNVAERPPVHCDPPTILKMISNSERR